ncbi:actin-related protein 2/3 complex subunit 2B isoform X2 [Vigna umbellata]|uniref:actin-related protein 2/3 complex subunit 2B isoform X2 n=1 Tax=Vigna umbellata TaxID=87088 RepID=UPI001F5F7E01|nr:actin-related protein 2/3 complex subunit 2B isoform X2 [Vigna umbellata]
MRMACIDRASPALNQILLKLYCAEKALEIDHHLYEFGSVEYHIQSQASDPQLAYLSISTPPLCHGVLPKELSSKTIEMVKGLCPNVVEIIEPAKEGYQLTLKLNLNQIPRNKATKNHSSIPNSFQGKVRCDYCHNFLSGSSDKWAKVPPCSWSAIPPPELRGEAFEDLSTNGGFFTFDISSRHVEGNRLDKTVWSLLNFSTYVRYHVKSTKGFIQRRMRKRLESLVEVLHQTNSEEHEQTKQHQVYRYTKKLVRSTKYVILKQRWGTFGRKIKRIGFRLKINGFTRFRQRWLRFPKFSTGYTKI